VQIFNKPYHDIVLFWCYNVTVEKSDKMSETRKRYMLRLVGRIMVLIGAICLCFIIPSQFDVLEGNNFFKSFSILHVIWVIWMIDMYFQIIPVRNKIPLGSQKLFANRFKPLKDKINYQALRNYVISTTKGAYKVMIIWVLFIALIGMCYYQGWISKTGMILISIAFYVCDLICVLIWCPFRLIMKNRCCTTCRIFNWDHLMMFSPLVFVGGFYCWSLALVAIAAWLVWELCVMMYPERFWEITNTALRCSECSDKLCTQYCQKLRK
jgi:hypothetical protein